MQEVEKIIVKKGKATELSQKVAEVLSALRNARGLSQRDVADRLGVSFQQYQKYEKGRDRLSLEKAILLCAHMSVPLTIFMEGIVSLGGFAETEQEGFSVPPAPKPPLTAEEKELLTLFARVPKKNRQNFLETVRQLLKMA